LTVTGFPVSAADIKAMAKVVHTTILIGGESTPRATFRI
jgi:hypothetical protein